jgi:tetratricopeptide (TPR) repeat protein
MNIIRSTIKVSYILILAALLTLPVLASGCTDNYEQYVSAGDQYMSSHQANEAIEQYSKALETDPEPASIYYKRGMAYRSLGMLDEALQDFNRTIEIEPDDAYAYHARSLVYSLLGEDKLATEDMTTALNIDGNVTRYTDEGMALAYYKLGIAYLNSGGYLLAQGFLGKSLTLEPTIDAYLARSEVHMIRDGYHQAVLDLTKVIEMAPDMATAYSKRGAAYIREGELSLAKEDLDKAISMDPGNAEDFHNRAYLYMQSDNTTMALKDIESAIALDAGDYLAYSYRGEIYLANGEYEKALEDFTFIIRNCTDSMLVMQANDNIMLINSIMEDN